MTQKKQNVALPYINGAETIKRWLETGENDEYTCWSAIMRALIRQGEDSGINEMFPEAFNELLKCLNTFDGFGMKTILENFISKLKQN